ncbi:MAG: hypothetical protein JWQ84_2169 [Mucilaginibacter sp.]|nr:hypothetical protein [Mucilaginibacter sp.]MDB5017337.1 hypothetical protein [Mucilaginibacter sp.]
MLWLLKKVLDVEMSNLRSFKNFVSFFRNLKNPQRQQRHIINRFTFNY